VAKVGQYDEIAALAILLLNIKLLLLLLETGK
jgi:hypothetical protein